MNVVYQWLSVHGDVLVFVIQLLFVVVCSRKPLPGQRVDEQRMLLQVLLQGILLRDDPSVIVPNIVLQTVIRVRVADVAVDFILPVLHIVQLLVGEVVEREISRGGGGVHWPSLPRGEAEDGAHFGAVTSHTHPLR